MWWWQIVLTLGLAMALVLLAVLDTWQPDTDDTGAVIKESRKKRTASEERSRRTPERRPTTT